MIVFIAYLVGYVISLPIIGRTIAPEGVRRRPDGGDVGLLLFLGLTWPVTLWVGLYIMSKLKLTDSKLAHGTLAVSKRYLFGVKD